MSVWCHTKAPVRVLLVRRVPARAAGWQPVTGRVEPGESHEAACVREIAEETGLPPPDAVEPLGHASEFTGYDGRVYLQRAFAARYADAILPRVGPEHEEARWVDPAEARAMLRWDDDRETLTLLLARHGQPSNS